MAIAQLILGEHGMYAYSAKRERDRRYDAKRRVERPWRGQCQSKSA